MNPTIACVVEGHGEVSSVPILLRRLAADAGRHDLHVPRPVRCPKSKFVRGEEVNQEELSRALALAIGQLPSREKGAVLVIIDADESCPAQTAPEVLRMARSERSDVTVSVVLAKREYEAWFVAAVESLKKHGRLPASAVPHPDPEGISDPKGYLRQQMGGSGVYSETVDQPSFTAVFDFAEAERCRSFRKLRKEISTLLERLYRQREGQ